MGVLELKDSRIDQCQSSGGMKASLVEREGKKEGASGTEKSYHRVVRVGCGVSNHEFFNVLSPNGPLRPHIALPGSLKIIEDLS